MRSREASPSRSSGPQGSGAASPALRSGWSASLALLAGALLAAGCGSEAEPTGTSAPDPARVQVAAALGSGAASMHGSRAAFEQTDVLRVRLVRSADETTVVDRTLDFDPSSATTEVSLRISLEQASEDFLLSLVLVAGDSPVFRGEGSLTLRAGETTTVELDLQPIPDGLVVPSDVPPLTALGEELQLEGAILFVTGDTIPELSPTWSSLDPEVATVSPDGRVVAQSAGEARMVASFQDLEETLIVVVDPVVDEVLVEPAAASAQVGESVQFSARAEDANDNELTGRTVTWSSSNAAVASVDGSGLASAVGEGSTTIQAEVEGVVGTATMDVTEPVVENVTVEPGSATLEVGETFDFDARVEDAAGEVITGRTVTWSSTAPTVATVDATGLVEAVSEGSTTIRATVDEVVGTASVEVVLLSETPVANVEVLPEFASVEVGQRVQFVAEVTGPNGTVLTDREVTWSSGNPSVATIDQDGVATAESFGQTTITAEVEGVAGQAQLEVNSPG